MGTQFRQRAPDGYEDDIMAKSSKPTGLGVDRKSNKFVCTWKPPSNCESQKFDATLFGDTATLGKSVSKKTVEIDLSGRYPAGKKLTTFTLKVKAKCEKKDWSDWADKSYTINPPKKPTISAELTAPNQCKFTWNVDKATNDSWYPFTRVQIQSKLVKDCTWDPKDDDWKGAAEVTSNKASHEKSYTETTSVLAQGSYTRIVRIRAQGPGGDSGWAYSKWVYATPKQAEQTEGEVNETSAGYDIFVKWDTTYDKSTPIDETDIEWVIT